MKYKGQQQQHNLLLVKITCVGILAVAGIAIDMARAEQAQALVYPPAFYNTIAWTWSYNAPATSKYNCLAYALGYTDRWIWPWIGKVSSGQVNMTMALYGKKPCTASQKPTIICYGVSPLDVRHFSRTISSSATRAKWGQLERMNSASWHPYFLNSPSPQTAYGTPLSYYKPY